MADQGDDFQRHVPVHPLPEEIQAMNKDDTICKFCGVSYLIHREIKKLEDRIKELELSLEDYNSLKTKETQFRQLSSEQYLKIQDLDEKLTTRIQMISSLNNDIEAKEMEISQLKKSAYDSENSNNKILASNESLKKKLLVYDSVVTSVRMSLSEQRSELKRLELDAKDQKILVAQYVQHIQNNIEKFSVKHERETKNYSEDVGLLRAEINSLIKEKAKHDEQVDFYEKQNDSFQNVKRELNSQIVILNDELAKMKNFNAKYTDMDKENRKLLEKVSEYKNEIQNLKFRVSEAGLETDEARRKLETFQAGLSQSKNAFEMELKLKNDAVFKAKNELDSIKKRYEEKDKFEKEILNNHQINLHEVTNLKYEIKNLKDKLAEMESDKNAMILAHQCQITQLKDSFKEKLRRAELSPEKLAEEVNKEREKFRHDMRTLEADLNQNFKIEFEIQQNKYNEMYAKYQQISKDFEGNSKSRISDLEYENQKLTTELKNLHTEKLHVEKKLKEDLESLRTITKELHQRLEKYNDDEDMDNAEALKREINVKTARIKELENVMRDMEGQLEASKEETKLLQETVHNECLERHELHEKLEEARDELLELKKNAYSSQQLIPLKMSVNKNNLSTFKNGTGLIDVNNPPDNYPKTYPKTLNEMQNSSNAEQSAPNTNRSSHNNNNRRGSASHGNSNSNSEKSSAESSAKVVEPWDRNKASKVMALMSNKYPSEPVQLFKKLNELSQNVGSGGGGSGGHAKNKASSNTTNENKKRISLLLARKS